MRRGILPDFILWYGTCKIGSRHAARRAAAKPGPVDA